MRTSFTLLVALLCCSCASKSRDVIPAYVSPIQYGGWSCNQMSNEAYRITHRMNYLRGIQDEHAKEDTRNAVVPVAIRGDDQQTAELAKLKGELDGVERAYVQRGCGTPIGFGYSPYPMPPK